MGDAEHVPASESANKYTRGTCAFELDDVGMRTMPDLSTE